MWALKLRPLLRREYDAISGDLIHAHFGLPDGFAAAVFAQSYRAPFVLTAWGDDLLVHPQQWFSRQAIRRTLRRVDAL